MSYPLSIGMAIYEPTTPCVFAARLLSEHGVYLDRERIVSTYGYIGEAWSEAVADSYEAQAYTAQTGNPF